MSGDHADNPSAAADERRRLAGVNPGLKINLLVFGAGHELAGSYFRRNRPFSGEQRESARTFRVRAHPLPKSGSLWIEASKRQELQFAASSPLWKQHLQTGEIRAHDANCSIDDALIGCPVHLFMDTFKPIVNITAIQRAAGEN